MDKLLPKKDLLQKENKCSQVRGMGTFIHFSVDTLSLMELPTLKVYQLPLDTNTTILN